MRIEHIAIWVRDLELIRDFYVNYFNGASGEMYHNQRTQLRTYFVSFGAGCRLELMSRPDIVEIVRSIPDYIGLTHFALSSGSKDIVDSLTERLRKDGFTIYSEPRTTGDGYYESVILDPEGNKVEITE